MVETTPKLEATTPPTTTTPNLNRSSNRQWDKGRQDLMGKKNHSNHRACNHPNQIRGLMIWNKGPPKGKRGVTGAEGEPRRTTIR